MLLISFQQSMPRIRAVKLIRIEIRHGKKRMTLWRVNIFPHPSLALTHDRKIVSQFSRVLQIYSQIHWKIIRYARSRYEKVIGKSRGEDIRFDAFRWRGASWRGRREKGKRRKVVSRFNSCRLLHIHKFCTECQPPVVMLRPRGRPGRLLAYFDDISASAVSPPLPLLLLLSLLRASSVSQFHAHLHYQL